MYYSPLEQFEPIPYIFPFKLGFFYIFGTNVTYILILLLGIFFLLMGHFGYFLIIIKLMKVYIIIHLKLINLVKLLIFLK